MVKYIAKEMQRRCFFCCVSKLNQLTVVSDEWERLHKKTGCTLRIREDETEKQTSRQ